MKEHSGLCCANFTTKRLLSISPKEDGPHHGLKLLSPKEDGPHHGLKLLSPKEDGPQHGIKIYKVPKRTDPNIGLKIYKVPKRTDPNIGLKFTSPKEDGPRHWVKIYKSKRGRTQLVCGYVKVHNVNGQIKQAFNVKTEYTSTQSTQD